MSFFVKTAGETCCRSLKSNFHGFDYSLLNLDLFIFLSSAISSGLFFGQVFPLANSIQQPLGFVAGGLSGGIGVLDILASIAKCKLGKQENVIRIKKPSPQTESSIESPRSINTEKTDTSEIDEEFPMGDLNSPHLTQPEEGSSSQENSNEELQRKLQKLKNHIKKCKNAWKTTPEPRGNPLDETIIIITHNKEAGNKNKIYRGLYLGDSKGFKGINDNHDGFDAVITCIDLKEIDYMPEVRKTYEWFYPGKGIKDREKDWENFVGNCTFLNLPSRKALFNRINLRYTTYENWFEQTFKIIDDAIQGKKRVFVHCKDGVSCSPTLIAAYLINRCSIPTDLALTFLRYKRGCVDSNFRSQLKEYEENLRESKHLINTVINPHSPKKGPLHFKERGKPI